MLVYDYTTKNIATRFSYVLWIEESYFNVFFFLLSFIEIVTSYTPVFPSIFSIF